MYLTRHTQTKIMINMSKNSWSWLFINRATENGTNGSKRMIINDIKGFWPFRNQNEDLRYGNIELRQNGIIVHLAIGRLRIAWVIL